MFDKQLAAFLLGFSLMFTAHYMLEPTWGENEPRPNSLRMIFNYGVGTLGIFIPLLYLHPALWFDFLLCVAGAGVATMLAHSRDYIAKHYKGDKADELIENRKA